MQGAMIRANNRRWQLLFLLALLVVAAPLLYRSAINNLVWLSISWRALDLESPIDSTLEDSLAAHVAQAGHANPRTSMGMGVLSAFGSDAPAAVALWQLGKDDEQLLAFGNRAEVKGLLDRSIIFYRGLGDLPQEMGWYEIGRICQSTYAEPERLAPHNQAYCQQLLEQEGLILNGDFTTGTLLGWREQGNVASIIPDGGVAGPAALLHGSGRGSRQSIYQRLTLPTGTTVRFSAYVYVHDEIPSELRLLYIGFAKPDGSAAGHSLADMKLIPNQWIYVERTYTIPEAQNQSFLVAPVQLQSFGQMSVDQVRLEILSNRDTR